MKRSTLQTKLSTMSLALRRKTLRRPMAILAALLMLAVLSPAQAQTFGQTTAGTVASDGLRADYKRGSKFSLTDQGTVTELCAYIDGQGGASGTQSIRLALYRDASGTPSAKIGETVAQTVSAGAAAGWTCLKTPYLVLDAGSYWITLQSGGTAGIARYFYDGPANWYGNADAFSDGASESFGAGGTGSGTLSVYAAYATQDQVRNWGRTTVGANPSGGLRADYKRASLLSIDMPGRALAFSVYMDGLGGGTGYQDVTIALYFGGVDQPPGERFLYYTANVRIPAGMKPQWITAPVAPVVFQDIPGLSLVGGHFWITVHSGSNAGVARYYSDGTGNWCGHADTYSDGIDNEFGGCDAGNGTISAFISFEQGEFTRQETIGNQDVAAATPSSGMTANYIRGSRFAVTEDGAVLNGVSAYLDGLGGGSGSQAIQILVYDESPGHKLVASSYPFTVSAGSAPRWYGMQLLEIARLPPGNYYLMLFTGANAGVVRNYGTPTPNWLGIGATYATQPPAVLDPPPANTTTGSVTLLVTGNLSLPD